MLRRLALTHGRARRAENATPRRGGLCSCRLRSRALRRFLELLGVPAFKIHRRSDQPAVSRLPGAQGPAPAGLDGDELASRRSRGVGAIGAAPAVPLFHCTSNYPPPRRRPTCGRWRRCGGASPSPWILATTLWETRSPSRGGARRELLGSTSPSIARWRGPITRRRWSRARSGAWWWACAPWPARSATGARCARLGRETQQVARKSAASPSATSPPAARSRRAMSPRAGRNWDIAAPSAVAGGATDPARRGAGRLLREDDLE